MDKKALRKVLKKDIVIPAGTVFERIDGRKSDYISNCFACGIGLSDDTCGEFIYGIEDCLEMNDWFK